MMNEVESAMNVTTESLLARWGSVLQSVTKWVQCMTKWVHDIRNQFFWVRDYREQQKHALMEGNSEENVSIYVAILFWIGSTVNGVMNIV